MEEMTMTIKEGIKHLLMGVVVGALIAVVGIVAVTVSTYAGKAEGAELTDKCKNTLSAVANARIGDKLCKEDYSFALLVSNSAVDAACTGVPSDYRMDIRDQYETAAKAKAGRDVVKFCDNLTKGKKFDNIWVTK